MRPITGSVGQLKIVVYYIAVNSPATTLIGCIASKLRSTQIMSTIVPKNSNGPFGLGLPRCSEKARQGTGAHSRMIGPHQTRPTSTRSHNPQPQQVSYPAVATAIGLCLSFPKSQVSSRDPSQVISLKIRPIIMGRSGHLKIVVLSVKGQFN